MSRLSSCSHLHHLLALSISIRWKVNFETDCLLGANYLRIPVSVQQQISTQLDVARGLNASLASQGEAPPQGRKADLKCIGITCRGTASKAMASKATSLRE